MWRKRGFGTREGAALGPVRRALPNAGLPSGRKLSKAIIQM
jgi:hypothetical protein